MDVLHDPGISKCVPSPIGKAILMITTEQPEAPTVTIILITPIMEVQETWLKTFITCQKSKKLHNRHIYT